MRYLIYNHPAFPGLLSKEELYLLVERSSLARGDLCTDTLTGRDHTVGEVINGMRPPRTSSADMRATSLTCVRRDTDGVTST